jgi:general secretion pathway protein J
MRRRLAQPRRCDAGFTMFEALIAIALMGLILGALAAVTAQWMPNWTRGLVRVQRNEQVAIALDRLVADLSAAEFVSSNRSTNTPLFRGTELAVTFVRSALGPNSRPGLEVVQIAQINDASGPMLVRTRAPFVMLPTGDLSIDQMTFADPVVLLRTPLRIAFAYAGPDGQWRNNWRNAGDLPTTIRFDVRDAERGMVISTVARIHVDIAAPRPEPGDDARPEVTQAQSSNGSEVR